MTVLATPAEIKAILTQIKLSPNRWRLSPRVKNIALMQKVGVSKAAVFEEIFKTLNWQDYLAGPEADDHVDPIPGDIWLFGRNLFGIPCYLKFQNRPTGVVVWISIHQADYPFKRPYR